MDLNTLEKKYGTEEKCREVFEQLVWPNGPVCPRCRSQNSWPISTRNTRECADCHKHFSLTSNTIFHGTKLGFRVWLKALYFILHSSKGVSSVFLARWIGVSQKSTWKILHAIRAAMETWQIQLPLLQGVVELDEKYLGGKPRPTQHDTKPVKRGRGTEKDAVFVAVERQGKVQPFHIESISEINHITQSYVDPKSTIMSDEAPWYRKLATVFKAHGAVNHSKGEYARGDVHNNTAESFAAILERTKQGVYHFFSEKHLHHYIAETAFRWNHRTFTKKTITQGKNKGQKKTVVAFLPLMEQLRSFCLAVPFTQVRRTPNCGIKVFPTVIKPEFGL